MSRHQWTYAGETFSISPDAQIEVAVSWKNGIPKWRRAAGRVALDACADEMIRLTQQVAEQDAVIEKAHSL